MFAATRKHAKAPRLAAPHDGGFAYAVDFLIRLMCPVSLHNHTTNLRAEQLLNLQVATNKNSETRQLIREDGREIQANVTMTAFGGWGYGNFPAHPFALSCFLNIQFL